MKFLLLLKILMEWSLDNKEYELTYFIYTNFPIGIPNKYLYNLTQKNYFKSLESFKNTHDTIVINDDILNKITQLFPKSKYYLLEEWKTYGYKFLITNLKTTY
jgi:hypothetical protein